MITLRIHHKTTYRYRQPVSLGPHRLMLRPRESRDLRLISSVVAMTPAAVVTWAHDVFGNAVATASFQTMTDILVIDSVADTPTQRRRLAGLRYRRLRYFYPFRYSDDEWTDLGALAIAAISGPGGTIARLGRGFVRGNPTDTLSLLKDLSARRLGADQLSEPGG